MFCVPQRYFVEGDLFSDLQYRRWVWSLTLRFVGLDNYNRAFESGYC